MHAAYPKHRLLHWASMPVPGPIDPRKVPRNARCPCGSGKKFKKCCLRMLEDIAPLARAPEEKAQRAKFAAPPSISTMFNGPHGCMVLL